MEIWGVNTALAGMRRIKLRGGTVLAGLAVMIGLAISLPAQARVQSGSAEKLRRLDIMLMVTGLRCRKTSDDFMVDYGRFTSNHMPVLNAANAELRGKLAKQGETNPAKALDRMSVTIANEYGNGHPWLSCSELRQVARGLALVRGQETLVEAADQLLSPRPQALLALAGQ